MMWNMSNRKPQVFAMASLLAGSIATTMPVFGAERDNPLDPSHQTPQQMEYWKGKVDKMDTKGEGKVTKEGFLKYYADLWEKNAPPGDTKVTINQLAAKWAGMEKQNPLDPEYKSALWRREHVKVMDTDNDGCVTKTEFLTHMEGHWIADTKRLNADVLTHEQVMETITNPLDPRYHAL
jgi:hypothetical protein